jgi:RNA polymerase sigma factor (TIGR02999 family)
MTDAHGTVSRLLDEGRRGDAAADELLARRLSAELQRLADGALRRERAGHTLQAGDLAQEAYLRLLEADVLRRADNRAYLFGAAARALRCVLIDYARRREAGRRGGGARRVPLLDEALDRYEAKGLDLPALHEALEELRRLHPRQCQVVDEYHFGGFTLREIAGRLGVSEATVCLDLKRAQLWLSARLRPEG